MPRLNKFSGTPMSGLWKVRKESDPSLCKQGMNLKRIVIICQIVDACWDRNRSKMISNPKLFCTVWLIIVSFAELAKPEACDTVTCFFSVSYNHTLSLPCPQSLRSLSVVFQVSRQKFRLSSFRQVGDHITCIPTDKKTIACKLLFPIRRYPWLNQSLTLLSSIASIAVICDIQKSVAAEISQFAGFFFMKNNGTGLILFIRNARFMLRCYLTEPYTVTKIRTWYWWWSYFLDIEKKNEYARILWKISLVCWNTQTDPWCSLIFGSRKVNASVL